LVVVYQGLLLLAGLAYWGIPLPSPVEAVLQTQSLSPWTRVAFYLHENALPAHGLFFAGFGAIYGIWLCCRRRDHGLTIVKLYLLIVAVLGIMDLGSYCILCIGPTLTFKARSAFPGTVQYMFDAWSLGESLFLLLPGLAVAGALVIARRQAAQALVDGPQCAKCGYCLRGNTSGRCPECGEPILQAPAS
jgi:hypothetical protein